MLFLDYFSEGGQGRIFIDLGLHFEVSFGAPGPILRSVLEPRAAKKHVSFGFFSGGASD